MLRHMVALGFVAILLAIGGMVLPPAVSGQERGESTQEPGWPEVFARLDMYDVIYEKPVVGTGEKPESYQQKATYSWTGGRNEVLEITLARDPAFKEKYSAETLKKESKPPKELEVNEKKSWQWEFPREASKPDQVVGRLVVVLDADKVLIIERKGAGLPLAQVAKKFDFAKIEKALTNPPKR
jgi:hypothetical protein